MFAGAALLAIKASRQISIYRQSQTWPKDQATIIRSEIRESSDGDGMSNLPEFSYRYAVAGVEYTSSRHTEGTPFPATEADVQLMLQRFPVGSVVQVAINPSNPSCAMLDTGFPKAWHVLRQASLTFIVIGFAIILAETAFYK